MSCSACIGKDFAALLMEAAEVVAALELIAETPGFVELVDHRRPEHCLIAEAGAIAPGEQLAAGKL